MLPASAAAAVLVLSLVPGWLFLRLSEKARRPRHQSDLQEVLELVAMGVSTTGLAVLAVAFVWPGAVLDADFSPTDARGVRELVGSVFGTFVLALVIAALLARGRIRLSRAPQSSLPTSVWWDVLRAEKVPEGKVPYALVTLMDGSSVEGVLSSYTWQSDSSHYRDIALRSPIRYPTGQGTSRKPPYDYLIIAGADIKRLALQYMDDGPPAAPPPDRDAGRPSANS